MSGRKEERREEKKEHGERIQKIKSVEGDVERGEDPNCFQTLNFKLNPDQNHHTHLNFSCP